jgi:aspartate aminotransferase
VNTRTAPLAPRVGHVALSPMMQIAIEADALKRAGIAVLDLGAGEPDFPTPLHVVNAAHAALDAQFTKYTVNTGTAELRAAIASRYKADHDVTYEPSEVIVTAGGKQALFHAAMALFENGDEVITHSPGWPTLGEQIKLAGATPVIVACSPADGFALHADQILAAVTDRTRGIIINTPVNPTGVLLSEVDASRLAAEARRRDLWVILDLCYDRIVYGNVPHRIPKIFGDAVRDRLVICGSASKTYAMTGWRCGWLLGPREVVQAANALQSHETSNVNSIAQRAAQAALTGPQDAVVDMVRAYEHRRDRLVEWLSVEPRLRVTRPAGAFYLFPSIQAFLSDRCPTSAEFASRLLRDAHVVVTPGEAFLAPGHVRISYAASLETLEEGAARLIQLARSLA